MKSFYWKLCTCFWGKVAAIGRWNSVEICLIGFRMCFGTELIRIEKKEFEITDLTWKEWQVLSVKLLLIKNFNSYRNYHRWFVGGEGALDKRAGGCCLLDWLKNGEKLIFVLFYKIIYNNQYKIDNRFIGRNSSAGSPYLIAIFLHLHQQSCKEIENENRWIFSLNSTHFGLVFPFLCLFFKTQISKKLAEIIKLVEENWIDTQFQSKLFNSL